MTETEIEWDESQVDYTTQWANYVVYPKEFGGRLRVKVGEVVFAEDKAGALSVFHIRMFSVNGNNSYKTVELNAKQLKAAACQIYEKMRELKLELAARDSEIKLLRSKLANAGGVHGEVSERELPVAAPPVPVAAPPVVRQKRVRRGESASDKMNAQRHRAHVEALEHRRSTLARELAAYRERKNRRAMNGSDF